MNNNFQSFVNKVYGMKSKSDQVKIFYDLAKNTLTVPEYFYFMDHVSRIISTMSRQDCIEALSSTSERFLIEKYKIQLSK